PDFVSEDGDQLLACVFFDQCVEEDEPPKSTESGEEGVRLRGTLRAVHRENTAQLKFLGRGIFSDRLLKLTLGKRRKTIEKRKDDRGRQEQNDDLKKSQSEPGVEPG